MNAELAQTVKETVIPFPGREPQDDPEFFQIVLDNLADGVYVVDLDRKIILWNRAAERLTGYTSDQVVGRRCADGILRHCDDGGAELCATRCPLQATMLDGRRRQTDVFLLHREGHRVPVVVKAVPLRDGGGEIIGSVEVFTDNSPRMAAMEEIRRLRRATHVDPLTSIGNRRFMESHIKSLIGQTDAVGWPFAVLFIDIDHFKSINDRYGHNTGDDAIQAVAKTLEGGLRSFDVVGRWGGEEFIVIAMNVDSVFVAQLAERLRALVESDRIATPDGGELRLTVSIGSTIVRPDDSAEEVVARADSLMYRSKSEGRNRTSIG